MQKVSNLIFEAANTLLFGFKKWLQLTTLQTPISFGTDAVDPCHQFHCSFALKDVVWFDF